MKKAFYSFLALTLILWPLVALGNPVKTESVEPIKASVIPTNGATPGFSTISYAIPAHKEEAVREKIAESKIITVKKIEKVKKVLSVRAREKRPETQMVAAKTVRPKIRTTVYKPQGNKRKFTLSAYTAGPESTGKRKGDPEYGITRSGTTVKEGRTCACPKSLPFGTKLYIPSLGTTYTCEDRGSAIKEGRLDIYIENLQEANDFGLKKYVEVIILQED